MKYFTFTLIQLLMVLSGASQPAFVFGDSNNNYPVLIKQAGTYSYVLGQSDISGTSFGTISKIETNTGNLIWQRRLDFPSQINDMVFIPPQGPLGKTSLYVVGHTLPFDVNNASFLIQIHSESAAIECSNIFDQAGRESFRKIVRNLNTSNPNFPYFILGTRGYVGGAPTQEKVILVNLKSGCSSGSNINFVKEYNFQNSPDIEFSRGLGVLNDGSMLLIGNETTQGYGMVVKVNSAGNFLNSVVYTQNIEILDAIELSNGNILFSGKKTENNIDAGLLFVTDNKLSLLGQGYENKSVLSYPEIATNYLSEIYLPCLYKPFQNSNTTSFPLVQRLNISGIFTNPVLTYLWEKSLENTNSSFMYKGVALSAEYGTELIYTDGRGLSSANLNCSFVKTNTLFNTICSDSITTLLRPFNLGFNNVEVSNLASSLPAFNPGNVVGQEWVIAEFCKEPCKLDFSVNSTERECNNVLFNINITNGTSPYTMSWDFDCDGNPDATGLQTQHTFTTNGNHSICVKVIDSKECSKEKVITINTNGDVEAPNLDCPSNITIQCNENTHPSNTGLPTLSDNLDPNPTLTGPVDDVIENAPCLIKIVRTWKAEDDCKNESTCNQIITIKDEIAPVITLCGRKIVVQGIKDANGTCKEKVALFSPMVTDQCDSNPSVVNSYTNTNDATADYNVGETIVTWTATDQCGNTSSCRDTVIVLGCDSTCCIYKQEFIDRVEGAVTIAVNPININPSIDCKVVVNINGLFDCDLVHSIEWGDGNITNNPGMVNVMHQYVVSGNYLISINFMEKDGESNCFIHTVKREIINNCCNGCRYNNPASFTDLKLVYSNGWVFDLSTTGTVPRPPNNVYINYSGTFKCFDSNACFHELFHNAKPSYSNYPTWLYSPGSSNFSIQLPIGVGNYNNINLTSYGSCWTAPAAVGFSTQCQSGESFSFRDCDCDNQFKNDVNQGFLINHVSNSCDKKFTPHRLSVCDQVTWNVNGVMVANNSGYNTTVGPFQLISGLNEVCMVVSRPSSTTTCKDTFCQQIFCLSNPSCPNVPNSGLDNNGNTGLLRDVGISDWKSCDDNVIIHEDGYLDQGSLLMAGSMTKPAIIVVDIKESNKILKSVNFALKQYFTDKLDTNAMITLQNQSELCGGQVIELSAIKLSNRIKGWENFSFEINNTLKLPYRFMAIKVDTRDTFPPNLYKIDNICFDFISALVNEEVDNISIYPNPTSCQITLDFNNGNAAFDNASILDFHGRLIKTIPLTKGITKQEIDLFKYESGMYLLRLIDRNGGSVIKKIVKVD